MSADRLLYELLSYAGREVLLPCPFCGADTTTLISSVHRTDAVVSVYCAPDGCGGSGPSASSPAHAIRLWNLRALTFRNAAQLGAASPEKPISPP